MIEEKEVLKSHCNNCDGYRNHFLLHKKEVSDSEYLGDGCSIDWWDCYEMLECCGCNKISMRHMHCFSEDTEPDGSPTIYTTHYPHSEFRQKPNWYNDANWAFEFGITNVRNLLDEVYICIQNDAPRLAAMGVRSLIEHIMIDKVGDQDSFVKNLSVFESKGFISEHEKEIIESALEVGHAVTHRSYNPEKSISSYAIDIAENLIERLYINPSRAKKIKEKTPERKKRGAKC